MRKMQSGRYTATSDPTTIRDWRWSSKVMHVMIFVACGCWFWRCCVCGSGSFCCFSDIICGTLKLVVAWLVMMMIVRLVKVMLMMRGVVIKVATVMVRVIFAVGVAMDVYLIDVAVGCVVNGVVVAICILVLIVDRLMDILVTNVEVMDMILKLIGANSRMRVVMFMVIVVMVLMRAIPLVMVV